MLLIANRIVSTELDTKFYAVGLRGRWTSRSGVTLTAGLSVPEPVGPLGAGMKEGRFGAIVCLALSVRVLVLIRCTELSPEVPTKKVVSSALATPETGAVAVPVRVTGVMVPVAGL